MEHLLFYKTNKFYKLPLLVYYSFCNIIIFHYLSSAAELHLWTHLIPEGTESVNGSRVDGGCKVNITLRNCGDGNESFLTDDDDPVINTTDPNWASELVTVRKNSATWHIPYDYAVLSFLFQLPVSLTSIRLSLFKCPQWGIGASNFTVYVDNIIDNNFLNFDTRNRNNIPLAQYQNNQSSCNDLVSVTIPLKTDTQYRIWYIVVSFKDQPDIDWVYVGEVQFYGAPPQPSALITSKPGIYIYC